MASNGESTNLAKVRRYYDRTESRLGYTYLLGGTKHYGWYEQGVSMWSFGIALRRMEDELARRLDRAPGSSVLDAGCGTGAVARALAQRAKLDVTGIDILDWNIEVAKQRSETENLSDRTHFELGDYHDLPFPDRSFDGAYTMETLVHSADPAKVLREFYRVLKPGGRLTLVEYSHPPKAAVPAKAWQALEKVCDLAAMPAWIEFEDGVLDDMLAKIGFTDVSTEDVTPRMLPMLHAFYLIGRFPYFVGRTIGKVEKTVNAMSGVEMYRHRPAWRYNITVAQKPA